MKVIICGAGQVGYNIARSLAREDNDITVIDQSEDLIRKLSESLDIKGLIGYASHPDVLEQAGAADADMLIAVTASDEVNMVACQVAHALFNVPTKIARVRHQGYLQPMWADLFSRENLPIDVIISPELEVARAIGRRLKVPGATDVIPFAGDRVYLVSLKADAACPVVNTPLAQLTELFPDLTLRIVAIIRGDRMMVPTPRDQILPGDQIYFVADREHVPRAMAIFGFEEREARRIVVVGGGNIGLFLTVQLEKLQPRLNIKLIEADRHRAERIADRLSHSLVLSGSGLDPDLLGDANISHAETIVTVTNDDESNILSALLAKRLGCKRAMALVNNPTYPPLISSLGVDVVINPRAVTVSRILQHVRRGRIHAVYSLHDGGGEIIEADALETSPLVGRPLRDTALPPGVIIGAVVRDGKVMAPDGDTIIKVRDRIVLFALADSIRKVEKLFSVRLEFF
ncbi:Trk system potassium transporter TrkA [Tistrella bauzanensis]|uniref:Trk system potassium uptake protein TrkA n=2 Tax=Tistrella TaxID=171436 RepID=A0ABU9YEW0_9PROT|nr:Trk system potassium transporter TrkA [Tistrella bauzanensis]GGB38466.1 Trk system potassium transport protein TrkA [Tistrella bauzanensis]